MFRSILLPTLIACFIVVPMLYHKSTSINQSSETIGQNLDRDFYVNSSAPRFQSPTNHQTSANHQHFRAAPIIKHSVTALPASTMRTVPQPPSSTNLAAGVPPLTSPSVLASSSQPGSPQIVPVPQRGTPQTLPVDFSQMIPDYGALETQTFRGNAFGPDLTSAPMQFIPVSDFQEIFRFDVSPTWAKQRWERLTAIPAENGLHGLRTALVTGTNSWDLNGALTYFFDQNHRTQRITFRGWVGDPSRLIDLVTKHFGLKPQPTHWAGLYVAKFGSAETGGLLMKDPDSIDRRNQVQRTAVIMEINQPAGGFKLSEEFLGFMAPAIPRP